MNAIRIVALSVLLCASAALAQSKKTQKPAVPEPVLTEKDIPKNCEQQCDMVEKAATHGCRQEAGDNKAAQKECGKPFVQMMKACKDSCRDKGRIDRQYMMERMKPPPGMKIPEEGEAEGDNHGK